MTYDQQLDFRMNSSLAQTMDNAPLCYEFFNGSCPKLDYPLFLKVPLYIIFGFVVILTVLGNLFVIITIFHFKQLHMPTNYFVLSLAVTDLLLGGFLMPPGLVQSVETCWYFGSLFCKIYNSVSIMLCTASILNLSFISIDRYFAVCQPLLYQTKITPFVTLIMISICWSVSIIVGFGIIFLELNILGIEEFYYDNFVCEGACVLLQSAVSSTASSFLSFYLPGIVMLCIYMKIFRVAQKQAKSIQDSKSKNMQSSLSKEEKKATKTLAVVLGVFLSLWLPFFFCNVINPFIGYSVPPVLIDALVWVGYMNSTFNPIVYAFFYKWFRKAFRMMLSGQIFQPGSSRTNLFSH
ncbi:trace amine-associated receptor 1-like [Astyanax mexicanus]|uniref:Trace amine-associated receptor 1 n=1 Tax=Astyanax mexicanus TaxID=7994 RepID=A0A8T2MD62_ASTMX|nr:trace amine-associated receptor 1-like [Astyanax mexicanus]KAG9282308.1 trace amine-associated receptor 1-like [Astyanax mexicanus]